MKILIVGGTKFFGIPMVNKLIDSGHDITVATRGNNSILFNGDVKHVTLDRKNADSVKEALKGQKFELVIDKVAYCSNDVRTLLANVDFEKYIQMSSCSVYPKDHIDISEDEFDAGSYPLTWTDLTDDYAECKRQAERAVYEFADRSDCAFVRYPVVMGEHDYTGRLAFYIRHIENETPMMIEGAECKMSFIHEKEAGEFIAHLADHFVAGAVNGCSSGILEVSEIIRHMEEKLGKRAIISQNGDLAPYNTDGSATYNTQKAAQTGFIFSNVQDWIFELINYQIIKKNKMQVIGKERA